jgi:hypothetical protein
VVGDGNAKTVLVHPDGEQNGAEATKILSGLLGRKGPALPKPDTHFTLREAAQLTYKASKSGRQQ